MRERSPQESMTRSRRCFEVVVLTSFRMSMPVTRLGRLIFLSSAVFIPEEAPGRLCFFSDRPEAHSASPQSRHPCAIAGSHGVALAHVGSTPNRSGVADGDGVRTSRRSPGTRRVRPVVDRRTCLAAARLTEWARMWVSVGAGRRDRHLQGGRSWTLNC